jgi:hypothetical protein
MSDWLVFDLVFDWLILGLVLGLVTRPDLSDWYCLVTRLLRAAPGTKLHTRRKTSTVKHTRFSRLLSSEKKNHHHHHHHHHQTPNEMKTPYISTMKLKLGN